MIRLRLRHRRFHSKASDGVKRTGEPQPCLRIRSAMAPRNLRFKAVPDLLSILATHRLLQRVAEPPETCPIQHPPFLNALPSKHLAALMIYQTTYEDQGYLYPAKAAPRPATLLTMVIQTTTPPMKKHRNPQSSHVQHSHHWTTTLHLSNYQHQKNPHPQSASPCSPTSLTKPETQ
jgi:hypothetical protein